jgi:hypothetical protein
MTFWQINFEFESLNIYANFFLDHTMHIRIAIQNAENKASKDKKHKLRYQG